MLDLFSGYIYSVNYEYSDTPRLSVTAMDLIRLMQENDGGGRIYTGKSYTEIFQEVMKRYRSMYKELKTDAPVNATEMRQMTQKGNDYTFVKDILCKMECRDFLVLAGKVYFMDALRKSHPFSLWSGGGIFFLFHVRKIMYMRRLRYR